MGRYADLNGFEEKVHIGAQKMSKFCYVLFFTETVHWADSDIDLQCMCVCLFVTIQNTLFRKMLRSLVKGKLLILTCNDTIIFFLQVFYDFLVFSTFLVHGESLLRDNLLWIFRELAGGGSPLPPSLPAPPSLPTPSRLTRSPQSISDFPSKLSGKIIDELYIATVYGSQVLRKPPICLLPTPEQYFVKPKHKFTLFFHNPLFICTSTRYLNIHRRSGYLF